MGQPVPPGQDTFSGLLDGVLLFLQTSQGVPQPNQGLACTLLFPVEREKEKENAEERDYSDGEDEKPPLPPRSGSTSIPGASSPSILMTNPPAVQDRALESEVDKVLAGLEILSKVFDQQSSPMVSRILQQTAGQTGEGQELDSLILKLSILKDFLSTIEKKALKALQDMSSIAQPGQAQPSFRKVKSIPVQTFEVKLDLTLGDLTKIGKSQKYTLIRQLIKSQRVQNKLGIVFEKEKDKTQRKDFVFVSARVSLDGLEKREAFCQLLQLMKNRHSSQDEPDMISVFIGTWNMGEPRGKGQRPPTQEHLLLVCLEGAGQPGPEMTSPSPRHLVLAGELHGGQGVGGRQHALKTSAEMSTRLVVA
ncbi:putative Phosphatidylinositol-345-trisphosphate 5-phosphatase 2-like protein, partial [Naja naja]